MPLLLFLLFLRAILGLAFRRAEQAALLLCNKHLPAVLAHVDRIIRIREHETEYQRNCQHQGMEIPYQGRGVVKQRNVISRRVAAECVHSLTQQSSLFLRVSHQLIVRIVEEFAGRDQEHPILQLGYDPIEALGIFWHKAQRNRQRIIAESGRKGHQAVIPGNATGVGFP